MAELVLEFSSKKELLSIVESAHIEESILCRHTKSSFELTIFPSKLDARSGRSTGRRKLVAAIKNTRKEVWDA